MGVVTKRADELKPGDMLVVAGQAGVVKSISSDKETTAVFVVGVESATFLRNSATLQILVPDLTRTQQHADALLAFVEAAADSPARTALLDKIHPPVAPTMDEVMGVLVATTDPKMPAVEVTRRIEALVAKARRAGWGK